MNLLTRRSTLLDGSSKWFTAVGNGIVRFVGSKKRALKSLIVEGGCKQSSTPTPDAPQEVKCNNAIFATPIWNQHHDADAISFSSSSTAAFNPSKGTDSFSIELASDFSRSASTSSVLYVNSFISGGYVSAGDKLLISLDMDLGGDIQILGKMYLYSTFGSTPNHYLPSGAKHYRFIDTITASSSATTLTVRIYMYGLQGKANDVITLRANACNLTQSFGAGNEPDNYDKFSEWAKLNGYDLSLMQIFNPSGTIINGAVNLNSIGGLYRIGTYKDTFDASTGLLTRYISKKIFDGTEDWNTESTSNFYTDEPLEGALTGTKTLVFCTHFKSASTQLQDDNNCYISASGKLNIQTQYVTHAVNSFKTFLAEEYANGTPVTVYYVLAIPEIERITPHIVMQNVGENTIRYVGDDFPNSKITVSYWGREEANT